MRGSRFVREWVRARATRNAKERLSFDHGYSPSAFLADGPVVKYGIMFRRYLLWTGNSDKQHTPAFNLFRGVVPIQAARKKGLTIIAVMEKVKTLYIYAANVVQILDWLAITIKMGLDR